MSQRPVDGVGVSGSSSVAMRFPELGVPGELVAALGRQGISEPTPIQVAALPLLRTGRDAYLNAETGTGKTLAYLLPLFCRIDRESPTTQLMVLAPSHELAIQIQRQCTDLAQNAGWTIRSLLLIGGTSTDRQIEKLRKRPHIVVGSPGRILELIEMRKLKASEVRSLVIDEADRLLDREGLPTIRAILDATPRGRQLVFASATEQPESSAAAAALAPEFVPLRVAAAPMNGNIEHLYVVEARDKSEVLRKLLHALRPERALVFVHRGEGAENLAKRLVHHGVPAAELHAAGDKRDRKRAMDDFRSARVRVLVATDVAARGLDIAGITHVFNLDVPTQSRTYLHRVGRTARAGAQGQAITLAMEHEVPLVRRYERDLGIVVHPVRVREGRVMDAEEPEPHRSGSSEERRQPPKERPQRPARKRR